MEIEIVERKENSLLNREEITFKIMHENAQTPSRKVVVSKVAAIVNADTDRTILKNIKSQFGLHESIGQINLYDSNEKALAIEPKYILIRNGLIEAEDKA